jgi:hypothetical protein
MKLHTASFLSVPCFCLLLTSLLGFFPTAWADNAITLQVAVKTEDQKTSKEHQEVRQRWMEISARAFHLEKSGAVKIEWSFFGDNLDSGKIVPQGNGTETIELAQGKQIDVKTKPVTFTYTPRYTERTGSGKRARSKTIEATGIRYHGWGVRAFVDGKLSGEAYSSASIKKLLSPP